MGTIQSLQDVYYKEHAVLVDKRLSVLNPVFYSMKPLPGAAVFICKRALFPTTEGFHTDKRSPFVISMVLSSKAGPAKLPSIPLVRSSLYFRGVQCV